MITVVSGVPRSGTSLMMQMLAAGGLAVLSDGARPADADNPRGYHEWEPVKRLHREPARIAEAEGRAVKVVSALLTALPADRRYRVLFMRRPLDEVVASQTAMLRRLGAAGPTLGDEELARALEAHLAQVDGWLARQPHLDVARVDYHTLLARPRDMAEEVRAFLALPLDEGAMAAQVDPSLHRHRRREAAAAARQTAGRS